VSAFLHSATLVKAGIFLLARLHPVLGFTPEWHVVLGHAGAITMVVGAVLAFARDDLKKMLAYTTVAGLGTIVLLLGLAAGPLLAGGTVPGSPSFDPEAHVWMLMLLVAAGAFVTVRAHSPLAAVASLGVSGFGVGMLFLLRGGPDLALTQVAVETLAVLLLLSVLRRSPVEQDPPRGWGRFADGLLSLVLFARGHHEPGGGFVGGLVAASAAMLCAFAFGVDRASRRVSPARLTARRWPTVSSGSSS